MTADEFNKCVDLYADNLYRFILKNVKDEEKARDIVQDTYEKLWIKVSEVESRMTLHLRVMVSPSFANSSRN